MGDWLKQLRKNTNTPESDTDKTDKTPLPKVSSVLSVRPKAVFDNYSPGDNEASVGSVSFVSSSSGHIQNFYSLPDRAGWDDEDWQAAFDERAAVLEFDGRLPSEEAERKARAEIDTERKRWVQ